MVLNMTKTRNKEIRDKRELLVVKHAFFLLVVFFSSISPSTPVLKNGWKLVDLGEMV